MSANSADTVHSLAVPDADKMRREHWLALARLFGASPDAELLGLLAASTNPRDDTPLGKAWNDLAEAAAAADPGRLDDEFHVLFIGLGRGEILPYGSWYLTGYMMDKPLARLRDDLAALGIERADGVNECEDHIAALAETMALLSDPEQGVYNAGQQQFFETHIASWVDGLFRDLLASNNARFYRPVARLGKAFIEFERSWLGLPA
ncbi:MAG: molecular chaperone TorD family protein [Wenzhouxiangellaceae bacterium]|nr:molecular chaperone TorD family protein [Wenzhouxiangellaceae bacterium]